MLFNFWFQSASLAKYFTVGEYGKYIFLFFLNHGIDDNHVVVFKYGHLTHMSKRHYTHVSSELQTYHLIRSNHCAIFRNSNTIQTKHLSQRKSNTNTTETKHYPQTHNKL